MKTHHLRAGEAALAAAVLCALVSGCGRKAPQPAVRPAQTASVPLPEWAPKNPSPEFLRAAKVLRPLPDELIAPGKSGPEKQRSLRYYAMTAPWAYELFGTLSDKQIQKFMASGEIRIPIKELTAERRRALDRYFRKTDEANKDNPIESRVIQLQLRV